MGGIIEKWTSMLTEATSGGLTLLAVAAGVAILVFIIIGIFSPDDQGRASTIKTIVCVLIFCAVAACGTNLVSWALS